MNLFLVLNLVLALFVVFFAIRLDVRLNANSEDKFPVISLDLLPGLVFAFVFGADRVCVTACLSLLLFTLCMCYYRY